MIKKIIGFVLVLIFLYILFGPTPLEWIKNFIGWFIKILKRTGYKGIF